MADVDICPAEIMMARLTLKVPSGVAALVLLALTGCGQPARPAWELPMKNAGEMPTPFLAPSIDLPTVKTAAMADLPDDEPVIGVVVNGKARAYSIKALSPIGRHVVNDVISHEAVSITYCDRTDCARVFTGKNEGRPLQIIQGGFSEGLLLRSDGRFYRQDDGTSLDKSAGPLPYAIQKHDRTTWKQWRQAHPDTEVYAGIPSLAEPIPEVKAP